MSRSDEYEKVIAYCDICGGELYESDTAWYDNSTEEFICYQCLEDWAKDMLQEMTMEEVKEMLI